MAPTEETLFEHLKRLKTGVELTITLLDKGAAIEKGALAAVGKDFLEIGRTASANCTIVPLAAIAKIDFQG